MLDFGKEQTAQAINELYQAINKTSASLKHQGLPFQHKSLNAELLLQTYEIIQNPEKQALMTPIILKHQNLRYGKGKQAPRTFHIVQNIDKKFILLLETKKKIVNALIGTKDPNPILFLGGIKKGKLSWRIDCYPPEQWVGMVVESNDLSYMEDAKKEAETSQIFSASPYAAFHTCVLYSKFYQKINRQGQPVYRRILYSKRALGSLHFILFNKILKLTEIEKHKLIFKILMAVKSMHDMNYVHQDLKLRNILLLIDEFEEYQIKITDYANTSKSEDPANFASSTYFIASPEIAFAYRIPTGNHNIDFYYRYYSGFDYFGKKLAERNKHLYNPHFNYSLPNKPNDMFSLGITLYQLLTMTNEDAEIDEAIVNSNPLLSGLLEFDPAKRFTIDEALQIARKMSPEDEQKSYLNNP